jgi:hypothetical protein
MPELPLLDSRGKPLGPVPSFLILQAIMLSPKDTANAQTFVALTAGGDPDSTLFRKTVAKFGKGATGGAIAGEVFLNLLGLKLHGQDASVGKAVFLVSRDLEKRPLHSGRSAPSNKDRVHRFWAKFRPAAHLWAAFRLAQENGLLELDGSDAMLATLNDHLLLGGDVLLAKASENRLTIEKNPWTLPPHYPRKPYGVNVAPPTPWALEILKEYKAPVEQK